MGVGYEKILVSNNGHERLLLQASKKARTDDFGALHRLESMRQKCIEPENNEMELSLEAHPNRNNRCEFDCESESGEPKPKKERVQIKSNEGGLESCDEGKKSEKCKSSKSVKKKV